MFLWYHCNYIPLMLDFYDIMAHGQILNYFKHDWTINRTAGGKHNLTLPLYTHLLRNHFTASSTAAMAQRELAPPHLLWRTSIRQGGMSNTIIAASFHLSSQKIACFVSFWLWGFHCSLALDWLLSPPSYQTLGRSVICFGRCFFNSTQWKQLHVQQQGSQREQLTQRTAENLWSLL